MPRRLPLLAVVLVFGALAAGCRKSSSSGATSGTTPIPPSEAGSNGCNGANHAFLPPFPIVPVPVYSSPAINGFSRVAAAQNAEQLFLTGFDGAVLELDFSFGDPPVERVLKAPGDIAAQVAGIPGPAVLSGIAVTSDTGLVAMEHSANVVLSISRIDPAIDVGVFGVPDPVGGFEDGLTDSEAKFDFGEPGDLCPTGDGLVYIADTGNHVIRAIDFGEPVKQAVTVAGNGMTVSGDGDIFATSFDTPSGLTVSCGDQLVITERGSFGGGNRLRSLMFSVDPLFGAPDLLSMTLAGDGTAATTEGVGEDAQLARPSPTVLTSEGEVYWVDALTGVLRRFDIASGLVDCPLNVDCAAAVAAPAFTPGGEFGITMSAGGDLYVLDASAGILFRIP